MERKDVVLLDLYAKVRGHKEPEDHPASSSKVAMDIDLPLDKVLSLCEELADDGFIAMSELNSPPLLYLTPAGINRARRIDPGSPVLHVRRASYPNYL